MVGQGGLEGRLGTKKSEVLKRVSKSGVKYNTEINKERGDNKLCDSGDRWKKDQKRTKEGDFK